MTAPAVARLEHPRAVRRLPFAETVDIASAPRATVDEPSPCLPSATSTWYEIRPSHAGLLVVDLTGSTARDAVVRLYSRPATEASLEFIGCSSPIWNGQIAISARVQGGETLLAQVGTTESHVGMLVVRVELRP